MPKKRKTRKEKMYVDQKRQIPLDVSVSTSQKNDTSLPQKEQTFSLPISHSILALAQNERAHKITVGPISTESYNYLGRDLIRTALLTGAIVLAEMLIRILFTG